MPTIRDGRGQLTVQQNEPPPAVPPGEISRSQVSAARMADFAAERVAVAEGRQTEHHDAGSNRIREQVADGRSGVGGHWARKRAEKAERVFAALRERPGYEQAAAGLGMSRSALEGLVRQYRVDGTLPADVDELIKARARTAGRPAGTRVQDTPLEVIVTPPGMTSEYSEPDVTLQDEEASAPATAVVAAEQPERDGSAVGRLRQPHGVDRESDEEAWIRALNPDFTPRAIEGEDRCVVGHWIGQLVVMVCDRPSGHEGAHRGRLIRVGIMSETLTFLGHAAVPA